MHFTIETEQIFLLPDQILLIDFHRHKYASSAQQQLSHFECLLELACGNKVGDPLADRSSQY